jgi:hypothetical protein
MAKHVDHKNNQKIKIAIAIAIIATIKNNLQQET